MGEFLTIRFVDNGIGMAVAGGMLAVMFGGWGSARGLRIAGAQMAGALAGKPELFGKLLVLTALPGTQGFYGLIGAIFIAMKTGLMKSAESGLPQVAPMMGFALFMIGLGLGVALCVSAIAQGETSAASINLTVKKPDEGGRAILFPALVETYAVVALLAAILLINWLTATSAAV